MISVSTIFITAFFSYFMIIRYNRTQYDNWADQKIGELKNEFLQKNYSIQSIMTAFSYDQNIQRVLGGTEASAYEIVPPIYNMEQKVIRMLYSYSLLNSDIYNIYLIDEHEKRYVFLNYSDTEGIDAFIEQNSECTKVKISDIFTLGGEQCFAIIQPIRAASTDFDSGELPEQIIGHSIFTISGEVLKKEVEELSGGGRYAFLLDRDGRIMMSPDKDISLDHQVMEVIGKKLDSQSDSIEKCRGYVISKQLINDNGWSMAIVSGSSKRDFYETSPFIFLGISWFFVLCLISYIVFRLLNNINSFVYKLLYHMNNVGKGNLKSKIAPDRIEEFKWIGDGLNEMMEKVVRLSEQNVKLSTEIYKKEKEQIQNTLLALQSQMNPHFLYNTMECIKNIGICYGVKEIEVISGALSDILKYSLRKDHVVTVEEEIICIKNYMMIQTIRFEGRYQVSYHVDEDLLKLDIMRLSLEPLVENSIKHGFDKKITSCVIEVCICQDNDRIYMEIRDNGEGMPQEMIKNVMEYNESTDTGVALKNLFRRLKIFYQDFVEFRINSQANQGTSVRIMIDKKFYLNYER